jgi:hypothetical protein
MRARSEAGCGAQYAAARPLSPRRLIAVIFLWLTAVLAASGSAQAHNLSYSVMRVEITGEGDYRVEMSFHLAAYMLEAPQGHLDDLARARWEGLDDRELDQLAQTAAARLAKEVVILADDRPAPPPEVRFPDRESLRADGLVPAEAARASAPAILTGRVPSGSSTFAIAAPAEFAETLVSLENASGVAIAQVLRGSERSQPFSINGQGARTVTLTLTLPSPLVTTFDYGALGLEHIAPKGFDHILFVLALFFLTPAWRPLLHQVSAFTLAHSATLALATFDVLRLDSRWIEPLIAVSIVLVALDTIFNDRLARWRLALVFVFGLLHGLGFAGALRAVGLPQGEELVALLGFNVGVEIGQIFVLAAAFLVVGWARERSWFRSRIALPASAFIAACGAYWTIERALALV